VQHETKVNDYLIVCTNKDYCRQFTKYRGTSQLIKPDVSTSNAGWHTNQIT